MSQYPLSRAAGCCAEATVASRIDVIATEMKRTGNSLFVDFEFYAGLQDRVEVVFF
jgi:hypothetical protein